MALVRATVSLATRTGEPKDRVINVWHFNVPVGTLLFTSVISARLVNFYNAIAAYYGQTIPRGTPLHEISLASVTPNTPGVDDDVMAAPYQVFPWTMTDQPFSGSQALPLEVASCLSFTADYAMRPEEQGATRPRARRRGRVFLGPFNNSVVNVGIGNGVPYFDQGAAQGIVNSYDTHIAVDASPITHVIYSPSDGQLNNVTMAWMDNGFDTIRSRGVDSSTRVTQPIVQEPATA